MDGETMKRTLRFALVAVVAFAGITAITPAALAITKEEVMTLVKLGIPEGDIIKAIDKDKTVFDLKIQDILELKKALVPDAVIKYMLATAQPAATPGAAPATGAPATAAKPGAAPAAAPAPVVVREKTAEEIRAEEDRQREEARRLAEEQRKAEEARKAAYARGVLRRGLALAEDGKWVEAIGTFQRFVSEGNFAPGTLEAYNAKYGMAAALTQAGLYQSAAKLLVEVLLEGPDKPFFKEAFGKLRQLRQEIIYNPPDLEELTKFPLVGYSQQFQDEFNYVLGEFFYDFANYQRALKHFEAVSDKSPDAAKALYLTGLVQVRYKMYKSAVENLQKSINVAEETKADSAVVDLAYMALARIAYESENFDAAIFYYKKVPRDSIRAGTVFYELAWAYLMKGDYSRALGSFQALHSPVFGTTFYPELWILEARAYGDLCRYDRANKALRMFDDQVGVNVDPLKKFINAQRQPEDFYLNFVASVNQGTKQGVARLPKELQWPILSNVEFFNLYRTIRQIEAEDKQIRGNASSLGSFAQEMAIKLSILKKDGLVRAGVKVQQILTELEASIAEAQVQQTEIEVDINAADIDKMTAEIRASVGEGDDAEAKKVKGGNIAIVGGDTEVWPFEGEYWLDEVPYYRSLLTSQCIAQ
jgi:tetratricopeptide (TPR) repeat protein